MYEHDIVVQILFTTFLLESGTAMLIESKVLCILTKLH